MEQTITVLSISKNYNSQCYVPSGAKIVDFFSDDGELFCFVLHDVGATQIQRTIQVGPCYSPANFKNGSEYMGKYKDNLYVMGPEPQ